MAAAEPARHAAPTSRAFRWSRSRRGRSAGRCWPTGACDVLKGQCLRSNAGLFYESYDEFAEALGWFAPPARVSRARSATQRPRVLRAALRVAGDRAASTWTCSSGCRASRPAGERDAGGAAARLVGGGARRALRPARYVVEALPAGPSPEETAREVRVMTPSGAPGAGHAGYGDAIGNEVLGIQRVLRDAGYESEIFVETADSRLEHLTQDYRDLPAVSRPDNILIHHFSLGSRASRIAYALPDRMMLVYHNITPPEYFVDMHPLLVRQCYRGRRELSAYAQRCDLALGDSEFNRRRTGGDGIPGDRGAAGRPRLRAPEGRAGPARARRLRRRDDERHVRRPADARTSGSTTSSASSPPINASSTRARACCSSAASRGSTGTTRHAPVARRAPGRPATSTSSATSPTASWRPATTSPTCSSARASTRDSASRSSRRSAKAVPVLAYAADRRARDDGRRGRAVRDEGPVAGRRARQPGHLERAAARRASWRRRTPRWHG